MKVIGSEERLLLLYTMNLQSFIMQFSASLDIIEAQARNSIKVHFDCRPTHLDVLQHLIPSVLEMSTRCVVSHFQNTRDLTT